jgi:hypothetical protein
MQQSRINILLEEIAAEVRLAEKKNRELYTSAIDIDDEELSVKTQNESFKALRSMRGLKAAMETFRSELEKSGIVKSDSIAGEVVFISNEHRSIIVPREDQTQADEDCGEEEPEPELDFDDGLIEELSRDIEEINDFNFEHDQTDKTDQLEKYSENQEFQMTQEPQEEIDNLDDLKDVLVDLGGEIVHEYDTGVVFDEIEFVDTSCLSEPEDDFSGFGMLSADVGIYNNRIPAGFVMFSRRVDVRDWADMLAKVCEMLILKNPYTVAQFDKYHDLNPMSNRYFSYSQGEISGMGRKLSNGLWIDISRTPDDIVMLCKKVLELCGYPRSEFEIVFAD